MQTKKKKVREIVKDSLSHTQPMSTRDVIAATGLCETTVQRVLRDLRKKRQVYISGFIDKGTGGTMPPMHLLGDRDDASRDDKERIERELLEPRRHPQDAAFFGSHGVSTDCGYRGI